MPITVSWYATGHIIKVVAAGDVDMDGTAAMSHEVAALMDQAAGPLVATLFDVTAVGRYPTSIATVYRLCQPHLSHPRCGWIIIYGFNNPFTRFLTNMVMQMSRGRSRLVTDEAEALAFLAQQDETLCELIALNNNAQPERN
ncbi:MAG: hypothetical protein MUE40_14690 [Anaerolineae bacterium]|nr:hypothetical protein [Anaerolineae bacterium]